MPTIRLVNVESVHVGGLRVVVVFRQAAADDGQESTRLSPTCLYFNVTGGGNMTKLEIT